MKTAKGRRLLHVIFINNWRFSEMQFNISYNVLKGSYTSISVESTLCNINTKIEYPRSVTNCLPSSALTNSSKYVRARSTAYNKGNKQSHNNSKEHSHFSKVKKYPPPPISKNKSNYFSQKPKPTLALTQMNSVHKFHTIYIASFNIIFSFTSRFINYSLPSMDTALISFMRATCFTNSNFFFHFITQIPSDKQTQYIYNLWNILVPPRLYQPIIAIAISFFPFFNHKTHTTSLLISILLFLSESSYMQWCLFL